MRCKYGWHEDIAKDDRGSELVDTFYAVEGGSGNSGDGGVISRGSTGQKEGL